MLESAWRSCNKHNTNTAQRSNRAHRTQRTSVALDDAAAMHLGRFYNVHSAVAALLAFGLLIVECLTGKQAGVKHGEYESLLEYW